MACAKYGDESDQVFLLRDASKSICEFNEIFSTDYNYYDPFRDPNIVSFLLNFTCKALNSSFPKSFFVNAYNEWHKEYKSYVMPVGFHKAGNETKMFEDIAKYYGYDNALRFFNGIAKK